MGRKASEPLPKPYTIRFGQALSGPGATVPIFVATEDWVWVLRDLIVYSGVESPQSVFISIYPPGGGEYPIWVPTITGPGTAHLELRQVLLPGEMLAGHSAVTNWICFATGYQLSLT